MQKQFDFLRITRDNCLAIIDQYSIDRLNHIPTGFNNNLIWNLGHLVVTQQLLCYKLSGLDPHVSNEWIAKYRKGSKPEAFIDEAELSQLRQSSALCIDQTMLDYENGLFQNYKEYRTSYNATLNSIDDAISFNNIHEGLHLGSMMALRKLL